MRDALCVEYPDVDWFPDRGASNAEARRVCSRCLVQRECREYAIERGMRDGIWGGIAGREWASDRRGAESGVASGAYEQP